MGTDVHLVIVDGPAELLDAARDRIDDLERRWSRFLPDSELCMLNAHPGETVAVSEITAELIALAVEQWRTTGGLYDPTVLPALTAAGYDRSFDEGLGGNRAASDKEQRAVRAEIAGPAPGCGGIEVSPGHVRLPAGVALDLGGIGKGRAADLIADDLAAGGAAGACVNMGGDLRVFGPAPNGEPGWGITIDDPRDASRSVATIGLVQGALATSSTTKRRWTTADGVVAHHLIDPRTGRPAQTDVLSATVIAGTAVEAEVLAKVAVLRGTAPEAAPALLVHADGRTTGANGIEGFSW